MAVGGVTPLLTTDPTLLGPHTLEGVLGTGGMGRVYLGRSPQGRRVAVKVIHEHLARDGQYLARFQREARIACSVAPFCTAEVLDFGVADGRPYIVTEFLDGPTLAEAVDENGPLSTTDLHQLAVAIAAALTSIHNAGLVHRDVKPGNVLLSKTGPRLIDFGVAMSVESASLLTGASDTVGTPAFMAPEQAAREATGAAADVFAWGGVVAFAGTGRSPFGLGAAPAVMYRVVHGEPDLDGLDTRLLPLVRAAMSKKAPERPTATDLLGQLTGSTRPMAAMPPIQAQPRAQAAPGQPPVAEPMQTAVGIGPPATPPPVAGAAAAGAELLTSALPPAGADVPASAPASRSGASPDPGPAPGAGVGVGGGQSRAGHRRHPPGRGRRTLGAVAAAIAALAAAGVALLLVRSMPDAASSGALDAPAVTASSTGAAAGPASGAAVPAAVTTPSGPPAATGTSPPPAPASSAPPNSAPTTVPVTDDVPGAAGAPGPAPEPAGGRHTVQYWTEVLRTLDRGRVAAYAAADIDLLGQVYTEASSARATEEESIRAMIAVGGHGQGGEQVIDSVDVLTENERIVVLRFTSHMMPFSVVNAYGRTLTRQAATGTMVQDVNLVPTAAGWRVSQITRV
ncbi:serine/threonine-protein kinase [Parafrankia sp. FMc2]|uniref:serine/threonine-protein kinase n=1 Tax=Parafrankia sp. FMc2 TaxID=3233196 RepID=UPI0034D73192